MKREFKPDMNEAILLVVVCFILSLSLIMRPVFEPEDNFKECYITIPHKFDPECSMSSMFQVNEETCQRAIDRCDELYECRVEEFEQWTEVIMFESFSDNVACGGGGSGEVLESH